MALPDNDYQILNLTSAFYRDYPNPPYGEILAKRPRPYKCILFQTHYDYFICVPYRTEIVHEYAYHFRRSARSRRHRSGLDYTKIVIISNMEYIENRNALLDSDEYKETMVNLERIKRESLRFVEDYVAHISGKRVLHDSEYRRRYRFSPLKYFHKELGLLS